LATDIGIDLGSSKSVIFSSSKVVLELPSCVTVDSKTFEPVYFGEKAKQTIGRTPEALTCIKPIEHGIISDYDIAESMLKNYMETAFGNKILRPKIVATLPVGLTELQHHSLAKVVEGAGGRNITVIESPLAIAFGLDIDLSAPKGTMIVDMGAGTTDVAVISMGGISSCESIKIASNDIDAQIERYIRREYNIEIGALTAEKVKIQIGNLMPQDIEIAMVVKGRNVFTGLPEAFEITGEEVYNAIIDTVNSICDGIRKVFEKTDPDLVADIKSDGIYLAGGGALLNGIKEYLSEYLGCDIKLVEDPSHAVVRGAAMAIKHPDLLKNVNYQLRSIKELTVE